MAVWKIATLVAYIEKFDLSSSELSKLISEIEDLVPVKEEIEERESQENYEENPASVVARENCLAFMD